MKFIIQIPQLIFAGAEKVLVSFANDLVERGNEVEILEIYDRGFLKPQFDPRVKFNVICSKGYTEKYYSSLEDVKAESNPVKKIENLSKLVFSKIVGYRKFAEKLCAKQYVDKEYDVAINYLETESPIFLLNNIKAKKYIQWYHTDVANSNDPEVTDSVISTYEKMDAVICVAEAARKSFIDRYPKLENKTYVIYNFFDIDSIIAKSKETFQYPTIEQGVTILLSVGRMTAPKKYIRFLNVLSRLKKEAYKFEWYVLGDGIDRHIIEKHIKNLGLDNCVHLEGLSDNPYKYMANCDLFVLPSGWEGFPTVTVEAKILNCAVLATDVSGIREQLIHGETGWIVDNDEDSIYVGLKYLLDNPEVIEKLKFNKGIDVICNNDYKYDQLIKIFSK